MPGKSLMMSLAVNVLRMLARVKECIWCISTCRHWVMQAHLDESRAMQAKVPKEARALMLPAVACGLYLNALQDNAFDVFSQNMLKGAFSPFWHQLQVKRHYLLGTY